MPLFEFLCRNCGTICEVLTLGSKFKRDTVACAKCGSRKTGKIVSQVSFKVAEPAKYSEEFLHKARPFLRGQRETAQAFADGKGSEDSRTFQIAERIGEHIDRTLATRLPSSKR